MHIRYKIGILILSLLLIAIPLINGQKITWFEFTNSTGGSLLKITDDGLNISTEEYSHLYLRSDNNKIWDCTITDGGEITCS